MRGASEINPLLFIEIEKAEHRDIVSTRMFFKLLVEYAGE